MTDLKTLDFYAFFLVPSTRAIHLILKELNLPFNYHIVHLGQGEQYSAEFLKISSNSGKVPLLIDSNTDNQKPLNLTNSHVILTYLIDFYRDKLEGNNLGYDLERSRADTVLSNHSNLSALTTATNKSRAKSNFSGANRQKTSINIPIPDNPFDLANQLYPNTAAEKFQINDDLSKLNEISKYVKYVTIVKHVVRQPHLPWYNMIKSDLTLNHKLSLNKILIPIYESKLKKLLLLYNKSYLDRNFRQNKIDVFDLLIFEEFYQLFGISPDYQLVDYPGIDRLCDYIKCLFANNFKSAHYVFHDFCTYFKQNFKQRSK